MEREPRGPIRRYPQGVRVRSGDHQGRGPLAWHAAAMGLSAGEIRAAIMQVRDLAKKGSVRRQREYAERTAGKAVRQAE